MKKLNYELNGILTKKEDGQKQIYYMRELDRNSSVLLTIKDDIGQSEHFFKDAKIKIEIEYDPEKHIKTH